MRDDAAWTGRTHYLSRTVIDGVHLFQGVTDATMGHGEGWQYLQAGRFLERAGATAALLDALRRRRRRPRPLATRRSTRPSGWRCCAPARRSRPTAGSTRPTCARSASPSSCCSTPSSRARCASPPAASSRRCWRWPAGAAAAPAGAPSGWPAGCTRRSTTARSTRSCATARTRYLTGISAQCAQIHTPLYQTLPRRYPIESGSCQACMRYTVRHVTRFAYEIADHRERDGGAHAAAQRRPAALPALRADDRPRRRA